MLVAGDTLFRNVSSLMSLRTNGISHTALLRRTGNVVDLYFDITTPTNLTSPWPVLTLPVGFRPGFDRYGALNHNSFQTAADTNMVSALGVVNLYTLSSAKRDRFQGTWTTSEAWPSTLPGAAT